MTDQASNMLETKSKGGRPRSADVPTQRGHCPVHGVVELRIYNHGRDKNGQQRTRAVCPACHAERNLAHHHARKGKA